MFENYKVFKTMFAGRLQQVQSPGRVSTFSPFPWIMKSGCMR